MECCGMKGFLSYLVLWCLRKRSMTGAELARELERRKGVKPSPGTVYPLLKELRKAGLIASGDGKSYFLTERGENELKEACCCFCTIFYDVKEMLGFCRKTDAR